MNSQTVRPACIALFLGICASLKSPFFALGQSTITPVPYHIDATESRIAGDGSARARAGGRPQFLLRLVQCHEGIPTTRGHFFTPPSTSSFVANDAANKGGMRSGNNASHCSEVEKRGRRGAPSASNLTWVTTLPGRLATTAASTYPYGGTQAGSTPGSMQSTDSEPRLWTSDPGHPEYASPIPQYTYQANGLKVNTANDIQPIQKGSVLPTNFFSYLTNCTRKTAIGYTPSGAINGNGFVGTASCWSLNDSHWEPSWNAGISSGVSGLWRVALGLYAQCYFHTGGINNCGGFAEESDGDGDARPLQGQLQHTGGDPDGSGEGKVAVTAQNYQHGRVLSDSIITATAGTVVTAGCIIGGVGCDIPSTDHALVDMNVTVASGHIVGMTAPSTNTLGLLTLAEAVTPSSAVCQTTGAVADPRRGYQGGSETVTMVCVHGGPAKTGGVLYFACDDLLDIVLPSNVSEANDGFTVTGNFVYPHAKGCPVYQGGTAGFLDLTADKHMGSEYNGGGMTTRTAYLIVGATDSTHVAYWLRYVGNQIQIPVGAHNFGLSTAFGATYRNANIVTACNPISLQHDDLPKFVGKTLIITGASPKDFNGEITVLGLVNNNSCLQWSQNGDNATGATGFSLSIGGAKDVLGAYTIRPGAIPYQVGQTNQSFNGTFYVRPYSGPTGTFAAGHTLEQEPGMSTFANSVTTGMSLQQAPTQDNESGVSGQVYGWAAAKGFAYIRAGNNNSDLSLYAGRGGNLTGPSFLKSSGFWDTLLNADFTPGTTVIHVGPPQGRNFSPAPFTRYNSSYDLFDLAVAGGLSYDETINGFSSTITRTMPGYVDGTFSASTLVQAANGFTVDQPFSAPKVFGDLCYNGTIGGGDQDCLRSNGNGFYTFQHGRGTAADRVYKEATVGAQSWLTNGGVGFTNGSPLNQPKTVLDTWLRRSSAGVLGVSTAEIGSGVDPLCSLANPCVVPAPATSSKACVPGQVANDAGYAYFCVAPNTWKRAILSSF